MKLELVDSLAEVKPLREAWNAIAGDQILLCYDWLVSWWEAFGSGHRLAVITVRDQQNRLVGLAPWYVEQSMLGPSIRCLGAGKACTDYMSILALPGSQSDVVDRITEFTIHAIAGKTEFGLAGAHSLELDGVETDAQWLGSLTSAMQQAGYGLERKPLESSWRLQLASDWDSFVGEMKNGGRRKARKAMRRLEEGVVTFQTTDDANFWAMFDVFVDLHQVRRTMVGQSGCFSDPRFHVFLKNAATKLLPRHAVRLQWLELASQPIAIQFQLVTNSTIWMYQSGMDPAHRHTEPGHTMVAAAISDAIQMGHQTYDFLRGDEPYKALWSASPVTLQRLKFVAPSLGARFREGYANAARQVRNAAKVVFSRDHSS